MNVETAEKIAWILHEGQFRANGVTLRLKKQEQTFWIGAKH